ncbi:MAG: hypothetical protein R6X18_13435 [Chloroflexota bacterium]|jgi:hypothetical protein
MNAILFILGLILGVGVAAIGGLVEYFLHLRRNREPRFGVPGCLVYTVGGLVLAGLAAIVTSFIVSGSIVPALIMGAGVLIGFYGGFILLVGLWFFIDARSSQVPSHDDGLSADKSSS